MTVRLTHPLSLLLAPVLAISLVSCADDEVEEDPRAALRDAVASMDDWDGVEITVGVQLDEAAQESARTEGELSDDELSVLMDSNLVLRSAEVGDGDDRDTELEVVLTVADAEVLTVRSLPGYQVYALIDLEAMEDVADGFDEGESFRQGLAEMEQAAGMFGMQEIFEAAREAEWIRVTGVEQMANMAEGMMGDAGMEQPDEEELEEAGRNVVDRTVALFDDERIDVEHLGSEDAGERVHVTARGPALREYLGDVLVELDAVGGLPDPTGTGLGVDEMRAELEQDIPDDLEARFDVWIEGGEISQLAVDVFEVARAAGEPDVPDGEFLIAMQISEFTGGIEEPDTDVTFDLFGMFGGMMGGMMGGLGDDPFADDPFDEDPFDEDPFADEDLTEDPLAEDELPENELGDMDDFCLTEEEIDQMLSQMPDDQREIAEEEIESGAIPVC